LLGCVSLIASAACASILGLDEKLPSDTTPPPAVYSVSGTILTKRGDGKTGPAGLVLTLTGANVSVTASGPTFTFAKLLSNGSDYQVSVVTPAEGEYCTVTNGIGKITNANVSNVVIVCAPEASCKDIKRVDPSARDGAYDLTSGPKVHKAYCDMTNDGGGWTLALKADGKNATFAYDSEYWTNDTVLNDVVPNLEKQEAKYKAFSQTLFTEVRLQFITKNVTRALRFSVADISPAPQGSSLKELFTKAEFQATKASRVA
jgi:hypothetical protein